MASFKDRACIYLRDLLTQWQWEVRLFLAYVTLLMAGRIALGVLFYRPSAATWEVQLTDVMLWLYRGFGFDARVATSWMLPTMLLSFLCATSRAQQRCPRIVKLTSCLRYAMAAVAGSLIGAAHIIQTYYFKEYQSMFNHWVFGMLYDDRQAIWQTISQDYPVGALTVGWMAWTLAWAWWLAQWGLKRSRAAVPAITPKNQSKTHAVRLYPKVTAELPNPVRPFWQYACLSGLALVAFCGGLRGSYGRRPLQNIDVAITRSDTLNRMVLNPFYALVFAFYDHRTMNNTGRFDALWPYGDLRSALSYLFPLSAKQSCISDYLQQTVQLGCQRAEAPEHIFIFVLESQDSWPLLPAYLPLGLNPSLHSLAERGVHFPAFVSSGQSTMQSLGAVLTGLPWSSVMVNFQPSSQTPYPTALAPVFKQLGYQVQFFYGGYLSWQRIQEFCLHQGFDTIYGGNVMGAFENNEWGVEDKLLLDFLANTVDPHTPSVNVILTTSNHPRYTVDLEREGCPIGKSPLPKELEEMYDGHTSWRILGHTWYTDRELGRCIRKLSERCPRSLFVITGDHHSRRFIHKDPGLYERKSVPLILYSPQKLEALQQAQPLVTAGSHIDIVPTVLACIAPRGFAYKSFGQPLLVPPGTCPPNQAYGAGVILGPTYLAQQTDLMASSLPWVTSPQAVSVALLKEHQKRSQAFLALSWWLSLHGDELPQDAQP